MKKTLLTTGIFIFCLTNPAGATPPSSIELIYDVQKGNLHVEIAHAAHDPREHHIRKVEVALNNEKVINQYFATQTTPASLILDIPLQAKAEDEIYVLAVCSEAGRLKETLIVPEEGKEPTTNKTPKAEPNPERKAKDVPAKPKSSY